MQMAELVATRSNCLTRAVGSVLVDKKYRVLSTGYNGVPRNFDHCTNETCPRLNQESGQNLGACLAIHSEQNALMFCSDIDKIFKIYVTVSPCLNCMVMLLNTSCQEIIYKELYPGGEKAIEIWSRKIRKI